VKLAKADSFHPWVIAVEGGEGPAWEKWQEDLRVGLEKLGRVVGFLSLTKDSPEVNLMARRAPFLDCDLLLIVGKVQDPLIRLYCSDRETDAPPLSDRDRAWTAQIGTARSEGTAPQQPIFGREDLQGLLCALGDVLATRLAETPLYGLILAGGHSRRMQQDKALIHYHGQSQLVHSYQLLSHLCQTVLIACRESQAEQDWPLFPELPALPWSYDRIPDLGPLGGILTAMMAHPHAAFLVVAVDLPWLDLATLAHLIQVRKPLGPATAYLSSSDGLPEPLCAIYEPRMRERLFAFWGLGLTCPRKALIHSATHLVPLPEAFRLDNANTPDDFAAISRALKGEQ